MKIPILGHLSAPAKLIFVFLLVIVCFVLLSFIGILLAFPLFDINLFTDTAVYTDFNNPGNIPVLKYLQIIQSLSLFLIPALVAGLLFGGLTGDYLRLNRFSSLGIIIATTLVIFVSLPLISWTTSLNEMIRLPGFLKGVEDWMKSTEEMAAQLTETFLNVGSIGGLAINILMIAVIPALGEELFFRGLLQRLFGDWFRNMHVAIFFTAFLFAAIHLQFYGLLPRMLLGVLFGYLFWWTGSLWVPVFAHFLNNGSAVFISFLQNRGTISSGYEEFGTTENLFLIAGSALFTAGLLYMVYRASKQGGSDPKTFPGS